MIVPENEDQITRYLLGDVSEDEIATIEGRILHEPAFFDSVAAVEDSLIMNYVRGNLQARWLSLFEKAYLTSEARRARVESARILRAAVSEANLWRPLRWAASKASIRSFRTLVLVPTLAIAIFTFGWAIWRTASARQSGRPITSSQLVFRLKPGLQRSGYEQSSSVLRQSVLVQGIHEVRFDLEVNILPRYRSYLVLVGTPEHPATWSGPAAVRGDTVTTNVPAHVLPVGDYTLQLQGIADAGNSEPIYTYYFRVAK